MIAFPVAWPSARDGLIVFLLQKGKLQTMTWHLKLGVSLVCLGEGFSARDVGLVADSGVETLELAQQYFLAGKNGDLLDALKKAQARGAVRVASVHALFGGPFDISVMEETARQKAVASHVEALRLAEEFEAEFLVIHASGEPIEDSQRAGRRDQCRKSIETILSEARDGAVRVAVESLPRSCIGNTVDDLFRIIEGFDENRIGICLDTSHGMDRWREVPGDARRLADRLLTLHVSDYDGVDEKHQMPGEGVVQWGAFAAALREIGYEGPFNYEATPRGETVAEKIADLEENFAWVNGEMEKQSRA